MKATAVPGSLENPALPGTSEEELPKPAVAGEGKIPSFGLIKT